MVFTLPKLNVVGSIPIARSNNFNNLAQGCGDHSLRIISDFTEIVGPKTQ